MNSFKSFLIGLFFFLNYLSVSAQFQFTVDKVFFPGEPISEISISSQNVWVIKGNDSLGLGKIDSKDNIIDYSSQVKAFTNKPLVYITGKYGDNALLSSSTKLMSFKGGVINDLDFKQAGIDGNNILGVEGNESYSRILTDSNVYVSYDNTSYSLTYPGFKNIFKEPKNLLATALIGVVDGSRCGADLKSYRVLVKDDPGTTYSGEFPYTPTLQVQDFAIGALGSSYEMTFFIAHSKGLITQNFQSCGNLRYYLSDTFTYCVKKLGKNILIGTEKGLFYCQESWPTNPIMIPLNVGDVKIYSIVTEEEKGIVWLGTDKGLIRLTYNNSKTINDFILQPEWVNKISGLDDEVVNNITTDKNGNILITGSYKRECSFGDSNLDASNSEDYFVAKYTNNGQLKWVRSASTTGGPGFILNEQGRSITTDSDGNVFTLVYPNIYAAEFPDSYSISFGSADISLNGKENHPILVKYDKNGNLLWSKIISGLGFYRDNVVLKIGEQGNIYLATSDGYNSSDIKSNILKFDNNGTLLWNKNIPVVIVDMEIEKNGKIHLAGTFQYQLTYENIVLKSNAEYSFYILTLDKDGVGTSGNYIVNAGYQQNAHVGSITGISCDATGNIYVSGYQYGSLKCDNIIATDETTDLNSFMAKLNPNSKFIWAKKFEKISFGYKLETDSLGFSILRGTFKGKFPTGNINLPDPGVFNNYNYFIKIDPNGNPLWLKPFDGYATNGVSNYFRSNSFCLDHDNNVIGVLSTDLNISINGTEFINKGKADIFLFKVIDSLSSSNYNIVRGRVFNDKNENKEIDTNEDGLNGIILKAMPGELYSQSDTAGNYTFYLSKGDYTVQQLLTNEKGILISQTFPENNKEYTIKLPGYKIDTSGFDFADKVNLVPFISVDINSIRRRRCFRGTTTVQYCNQGFTPANDVKIKVEFPDYIIPISSDILWSSNNGKELIYSVGTVAPGVCKLITITDSVACGDQSIIGITQCTKAIISPSNNIIPTNPNWDKSDIEITGVCKDNGYIRVILKNKGTGNMSDSSQFRIFLDTMVVYKKNYKLLSGDSISLNIPANGKSLRAEADQTPYHPSNHPATLTMEGCRGEGVTAASKGFVNQFAPNDDEEEVEISCSQIIGSYDPNDKQVIPSGVSENHNIEEGTELEYILRFQNTGSDTAFTVVVQDTLSELLDITTFKPGVTSHNCTWNVSGKVKPVITCTFKNIKLPDSTTNEPGSYGFIKFKIHHKENSKGQKITNKALIYFDYNDPVITNEVVNTIGLPVLTEKLITPQKCNAVFTKASDSLFVHLCQTAETEVNVIKNDTVYSKWQIAKGAGGFSEENNKTLINNIEFGENLYVLQHQYCDVSWNNKVRIERYATPSAPATQEVAYCEGSKLDSINVEGSDIRWYTNSDLLTLAAKGNKFLPPYGISQTYFVKQSVNDCESKSSSIAIIYKTLPEPPITESNIFCSKDKSKYVNALGSNIHWYNDTLSYTKIGEGNRLTRDYLNSGDSLIFYATQSLNGCESKASSASIYVKTFNLNEVFLPNILSETGNHYFYLPHFTSNECVGAFEHVKIVDLNGRQLFYSEDENFQWYPSSFKNNIFLFQIKFSDQIYKGKIMVVEF